MWEGGVMMLMRSVRLRGDFGTSWEGELGEGGYKIMDKQVFQNIFKSTTPIENARSSKGGDGGCSSGISWMLLLDANGGRLGRCTWVCCWIEEACRKREGA